MSGKLPPVKRKVRHVFPTFESPMTMILKIRVWMLVSREEELSSTEDVKLGAASLALSARLLLALGKSMLEVRMVTLSSARPLRAAPIRTPALPPGARLSSSGDSFVIVSVEEMGRSVCAGEGADGGMREGRGEEEETGGATIVRMLRFS